MLHKLTKFTLFALIIFSHGHYQNPYVVTGSWFSHQLKNRQTRLPAQVSLETATPECKSDLFTVEELKREASFYEASLEGKTKLTGLWKHLNLEELPLAQARFFKALGNNFGDLNNPDGLDISMCQDAPCVINKVYNSTSEIEGWAIYLWWLKMGNIISFKNQIYKNSFFDSTPNIPGRYNGARYSLQDYLFSKDELYAFWKMSHYLPTQYKILTNLYEIQRIPRGATFEGKSAMICGLAWGSGFVLLQDGCLQFDAGSKLERGSIYHLVQHEFSHIVDNFRSGKPEQYLYYSVNDPWKSEGLWTEQEYLNTTTGATEKKWVSTLPGDKFVTSYAQINPLEHFAETLAFYRYNGEHTKKTIPPSTYDIVKKTIYDQSEYTPDGMQVYLQQQIERDLTSQIFEAAMNCYQMEQTENAGNALGVNELPTALSLAKRQCLYSKREELVEKSLAEVKLNTADGCSYLRTNDRVMQFKNGVRGWIGEQFKSHIEKALEDEKYFEQLGQFYRELASGIVPVQLMTECYREGDEKACYSQKIKDYIGQIVIDATTDKERLSADLERRFLESYKFEIVRAEMLKSYQDFVGTQLNLITESAAELWSHCLSGDVSNSQPPASGLFSVGTGWMVSSQYNCLNQEIGRSLEESVSQMSFNEEQVSSDKEKQILKDIASVSYLSELQSLFAAAKQVEFQELAQTAGTVESLRDYLLSDLSWIKAFESNVPQMCLVKAVSLFPSELRYHSRSELESLVKPACDAVRASSELREYEQKHPELKEEFHVQSYLKEVERFSKERASMCEEKHPAKGFFSKLRNRGRRSDCFNEGWEAKNSELMSKSQDSYGLRLSTASLERMDREGKKIRKRIKSDLMGEIIPDIGI